MDELDASTPDASTDELAHLFFVLEGGRLARREPRECKNVATANTDRGGVAVACGVVVCSMGMA